MRKRLKIVEVAPRDGLQNESEIIALEKKKGLVEKLSDSGVDEIEVGAFVSPKWVPQMKDTEELFKTIKKRDRVIYSALVPNMKGLERIFSIPEGNRPDKIAVFTAASETFNLKNINMSIDKSISVITEVVNEAKRSLKVPVRGYISTAFWCPFEGKISPDRVLRLCYALFSAGVDEISLGDTIGRATPSDVSELLSVLLKRFSQDKFAMHFHNTYGMAILNAYVSCRDFGIFTFDSSAGGLGGCPFAPGASGNVATEDLVFALENSGFSTSVNMKKVVEAVSELGIPLRSALHRLFAKSNFPS